VFQKGDQIGSYSLIEKLGKGSFGEVWLAEEKTAISSHKVALKLPNEEDVDLEAIRQEADVWETVKGHPNILPIIKADIYEGQIYIASEYAPDGSLSEWLKKNGGKAPSPDIAIQMIKGILSGLEHLHSKGVIHRDLKPANILLQADTPRIADFGIARLAKAGTTANSTMSAGTPSYMAPECFYSVRSEQTDIWAVGVLFHKLLTGKLPFAHPDQVSVMNAILNDQPNIDSGIPESLRQIIGRALQKDTAQRYKSAAEMRVDLDNYNPAVIADEVTVREPVVPVRPQFEKEEETVVRPAPAPEVYVQRLKTPASNQNRTLAIGFASFLILAAVTVWAALQLAGNDTESQTTGFSNSSNSSNLNSNLNNLRIQTGNQSNLSTNGKINVSNSQIISNTQVPTESDNQGETPAATPFDIKPDEPTPNEDVKKRSQPQESPNQEKTPQPSESAAPTPIEIAPVLTPPPRPPRGNRPTPKATVEPDETPPPPKKSPGTEIEGETKY
jgi:serine/threonine protein kinase